MRHCVFVAFCMVSVALSAGCKSRGSQVAADRSPAASATSMPDASPATAGFDPALVRETASVIVDGVTETWRLVWRKPPKPSCVDESWSTCLCGRLAFGETGELDLVRSRPGDADERFDVTKLFADVGEMTIPHWAPKSGDPQKISMSEIVKRPAVKVMSIGDFDHDGRATEFALQLGSGSPCGSSPTALVGISKTNPKLHKFDLTLPHFSDWETVRAKGSTTIIDVACGDHGAAEESSLKVTIVPGGFKAEPRTKACTR